MTLTQQLQRDLDVAVSDAALLARTQITYSLQYLLEALNFAPSDLRHVCDDILSELTAHSEPSMAPVVCISTRVVQ